MKHVSHKAQQKLTVGKGCPQCGRHAPEFWDSDSSIWPQNEVDCPCCGNQVRCGFMKPLCSTCYNVARRNRGHWLFRDFVRTLAIWFGAVLVLLGILTFVVRAL